MMSDARPELEGAFPADWEQDAQAHDHSTSGAPALPAAAAGWVADWGRLLRVARQVAGLSLVELAGCTGLSKGYLSKLESGALGAANPSRATLAALARALPSFRPLALTLAPGMGAEELAFEGVALPSAAAMPLEGQPDRAQLRLGWQELEVLAALMVLEASALPSPLTAVVVARAIDRSVTAVRATLAHLGRSGLVSERPPACAGQRTEYMVVEHALRQVGAARVGDLLLLATALIGSAVRGSTASHAGPRLVRATSDRGRAQDA
jgi:transcriptional regulator with XRE-family HTH domain